MMLPTTSVPNAAVAEVIVVVPLATPSATEYCAAACWDQSVPVAPATKPPPFVSAPVVRISQQVLADSATPYLTSGGGRTPAAGRPRTPPGRRRWPTRRRM